MRYLLIFLTVLSATAQPIRFNQFTTNVPGVPILNNVIFGSNVTTLKTNISRWFVGDGGGLTNLPGSITNLPGFDLSYNPENMPRFRSALASNRTKRVLFFGDSIGSYPAVGLRSLLSAWSKDGYEQGYPFSGSIYTTVTPAGTEFPPLAAGRAYWGVIFHLANTETLQFGGTGNGSGGYSYGDTISAYWISESTNGTAALQISTDSVTWTRIATIDQSAATGLITMTNVTVTPGLYAVRVYSTNNTEWLTLGIKNSSSTAFDISVCASSGSDLTEYIGMGTPNIATLLTNINPDLIVWNEADLLATQVLWPLVLSGYNTYATNADIVLVGHHKTGNVDMETSSDNSLSQDMALRNVAFTNNLVFVDMWTPMNNWATISNLNYGVNDVGCVGVPTTFCNIHLTAAGQLFYGQLVFQKLGLLSMLSDASQAFPSLTDVRTNNWLTPTFNGIDTALNLSGILCVTGSSAGLALRPRSDNTQEGIFESPTGGANLIWLDYAAARVLWAWTNNTATPFVAFVPMTTNADLGTPSHAFRTSYITNVYQSGSNYAWGALTNGWLALPAWDAGATPQRGGVVFFDTAGTERAEIKSWNDHGGAGINELEITSVYDMHLAPGGGGLGGRVSLGASDGIGQVVNIQRQSDGKSALLEIPATSTTGWGVWAKTNSSGLPMLQFMEPFPIYSGSAWGFSNAVMTLVSNKVNTAVKVYTPNQLPIIKTGWNAFAFDTTPRYLSPSGLNASSTESAAYGPGYRAQVTLTNLIFQMNGTVNAVHYTATIMTNGVATALTVTLTGTGGLVSGLDSTHVALIPSQTLNGVWDVRLVADGGSTTQNIELNAEILP